MKDTIVYLLKMVVDHPGQLVINEIAQDHVTKLEIIADPSDIGKIIGKQGRLIKAIRTIINAANRREKDRTIIEIKEAIHTDSELD